jgi:CCR4-NOT transcription complex subunit 9
MIAHIPLFLYPFLNTTSKSRPFEYLRLTSLGVIGALVKNDSTEVINFLLTTEIIPLCLRIMETGSELSKTVAIFIVQKILLDDMGLQYICQTYERFYAVGTVLSNMVTQLVDQQTVRLLKHVVRCFLRYVRFFSNTQNTLLTSCQTLRQRPRPRGASPMPS